VNPASPKLSFRLMRSRGNQPDPTFPQSPGIIHETRSFGFTLDRRAFRGRASSGSVAVCRFSAPPRWTLRRGAVAHPRHRRFRWGVPAAIPVVRATRREGDRQSYSHCQLRASTLRRTTHRRLFSAEDADNPGTFGPRAALTDSRRPLTSSWSPTGTPDPASFAVRCASRVRSLRIATDGSPVGL